MKQLITYSWKTWADWYQNKIIITTTKNISDNIVYITKPVKRYRKNTFGKMQVTWDTKNQAPRSWWQEGVQQNQAYKTEYQLHLPADFKCVLQKQDLCGPSSSKSFITQYQHYIPCGSFFCVKCSDGRYIEPPQVNMGDDAAENFFDQILVTATICRQHLVNNIHMKRLTQE